MLFLVRTLRSAALLCLAGTILCFLTGTTSFSGFASQAQNSAPAPNSDPTYQALRKLTLGGEAVSVSRFELKRDAGTFHLHSGTVCFVAPVNGKVTGAVFSGDGNFILDAQDSNERNSLRLLTKENEFSETFNQLVLRFTDSTYDEIKKAGSPASGGCDAGPLRDSQHATRHKLKSNLEARLLEDVLSPEPGGLFVAFIHGKRYSSNELYEVDPHGVLSPGEGALSAVPMPSGRYGQQFDEIDPGGRVDQVQFLTYDEFKQGDWFSFPLSGVHEKGEIGRPIRIDHQQLNTTLEKSANLIGKSRTDFTARLKSVRVVPLNLFHTLRVKAVADADGQPLAFIQEDKNEDAQYSVILPRTLNAGERYSITTEYEGKDAVANMGGGNYFPLSRENWYPSNRGSGFGEYTTYDMTFRVPKGMRMAATGTLVSDHNEGDQNVSVWKSEAPQPVAGFNFGKFRVVEAKVGTPEYFVQSFANEESPDWVQALNGRVSGVSADPQRYQVRIPMVALGTLETTGLNEKALAEGELAVQLYTEYFGPSLFRHLQITQQTACNFGQSWPGLIWIPLCYYFDDTVRHQLGMDWKTRGYWKVVTPHEVAHQWWGHTVGFSSYRDQWMSEGFADMSASLYLSVVEKDPKKSITFWNDERDLLLEPNSKGLRAIDLGPLTLGYRNSNDRAGIDTTRRLIYPKGAYVLHMIRMMMHDRQTGDQRFKETMQDFVKTYSGNAATTENFKAMVEKHMTREMDLDGNRKLDWFFNEYVYGTQLPAYKLDSSFDTDQNGDVVVSFKLTQSNVDDRFHMLVPVYMELADGNVTFLGRARIAGNTSLEQKVPLKGLKTKPRRAMVNYYDDVLASSN